MKKTKFFVLSVIDDQSDETNIIARLADKLEDLRDKFFCKDIELIRHDCSEDDSITEKLNKIGQGNKVIIIDTATGRDSSAVLKREKPGKIKIENMAGTRREFYGYIAEKTLLSILPDIEVLALSKREVSYGEMILLAGETVDMINGIYIEILAAQNKKAKNKWLLPLVFAAGALVSFGLTEYYQQTVKNDMYCEERKEGRQGPSYNDALRDQENYKGAIIYWKVTAHQDNIVFYKGDNRKMIALEDIDDIDNKLRMNMNTGKHARLQNILGEITGFENEIPVVEVWEVSDNSIGRVIKNIFYRNWHKKRIMGD
ncbi:MAG: hypothetical protein J7M11_05985 [Elusimicrobia bacterium]|nr:hypothetical protein [Elusimicrobiota bacterium]